MDSRLSPLYIADYAVEIFHDALTKGKHECFLRPDSRLPMMYIDDTIRSIIEFMNVPNDKLSLRTYNVQAMSFTPEEIAAKVKERYPDFTIEYKPDARQFIGNTFPIIMW